MKKTEYKYYLLMNKWLARLEKSCYELEPKEFFKNGKWELDDNLNRMLNDSIMDYGDSSVFDYDEISEDNAHSIISSYKEQNSSNIIEQMVDGIVGGKSNNCNDEEKIIRQKLSYRAAEYLMFMDDEEDTESDS